MRNILLYFGLTLGVDRNNFKKCSDSSFCERRRVFNGDENQKYKITSHSLQGGKILELKLEAEGRPCLKALHSILNGGSARIVVEECEPFKVIKNDVTKNLILLIC